MIPSSLPRKTHARIQNLVAFRKRLRITNGHLVKKMLINRTRLHIHAINATISVIQSPHHKNGLAIRRPPGRNIRTSKVGNPLRATTVRIDNKYIVVSVPIARKRNLLPIWTPNGSIIHLNVVSKRHRLTTICGSHPNVSLISKSQSGPIGA